MTPMDFQPAETLKRTQRTTINLTWTVVPEADIVLGVLAGPSQRGQPTRQFEPDTGRIGPIGSNRGLGVERLGKGDLP